MAEYNREITGNPDDATGDASRPDRIDCLKCRHYEVTWNQQFPRGCKVFGIRSREFPSEVVKASTGRDCPAFEPRQPRT